MNFIKKLFWASLLLFFTFTVYAMSGSDFARILFSEPKRFSKTKDTNTVVTPQQDDNFQRGRAQELRPNISVPPRPNISTQPDSTTLMDKQKFEDLISGLEKIASVGKQSSQPSALESLPVQAYRPANSAQKLKWLPPPPGFMTAETYNYLIYRQEQPVTPSVKTVLDDIHGNLMLDLTPFTIVLKPNKILIMLFNQRASYMDYTHRPSWSGAASDLRSDSLYVVEEPGFYPLTVHELTHLYFDGYFLPTISPLWLSEGMAVYMQILASQDKPSWIEKSLLQIVQNGQVIPFDEMMAAQTLENYSNDAAALWYTQSYTLVDYLLNQRSRDEFYRFCNELKANTPVYQALYRAYGMPFNKVSSLQNVWLHDLMKAYQEGRIQDVESPAPLGNATSNNLASPQEIAAAQLAILGRVLPSTNGGATAQGVIPANNGGLQQPRPVLHRPANPASMDNLPQNTEGDFSGGY